MYIEPPLFQNCPSDIITSLSDPSHTYSDPIEWIEPTVSDNADAFPFISVNYRPGLSVSRGVWRVIYIAQDDAGNESNCTFAVYVIGGAIKGCPNNLNITTDPGSNVGTAQWTQPVAHLPHDDWQFLWTHEPGQKFSIGETRVEYSFLDPNGTEMENCTFVIQVEDKEPPVFIYCPDSITQPVDSGYDAASVMWDVPTTTDNTGEMVTLISWENPGDIFPLGVTVVEYTATDVYSNQQNCRFSITIEDTEDPTFVDCPSSIAVSANDGEDSAAVVWREPSATDNADKPNVTSNYYSGDVFQSGITTVTYIAMDDAGNTDVCEFSVTVLGFPFDEFSRTGGFLLSGHDDVHLSGLSIFECLVACVEEKTFVCHSVDYNAIGECRLSSTKVGAGGDATLVLNHAFDYYERLIDYTVPVITGCPRDIIRPSEPGKSFAAISWLPPTASDSSDVKLISNHEPGEKFTIGDTDIVYTAIDERNNAISCIFTVTIQDLEYPQLNDCPSSTISRLSNGPVDVEASWPEPTATDNSNVVNVVSNHKPGDLFPPGRSVVRYTATDPSGNQVQCSFEVISESLSNSHRLLLSMVLLNFAFSDALQDRRTDQFKALSDALDNTINNVLNNDVIYQGAVTTGFRLGDGGGVVADVSLAFTEELSADGRRQYLFVVLEAWEEDAFKVNIQEIIVQNQDGSNSTVDACLTLPCPSDMTCIASGLVCSSYCNDNIGFCMNKGSCVRHEGHDLISCLCVDDNFYGRRCEKFELFNDSKVYAVVAAGIWFVVMTALIGIGLKVASQRKNNKLAESRKGSTYAPKSQVNYGFQPEADGTISYHPVNTDNSRKTSSVTTTKELMTSSDECNSSQQSGSSRSRPNKTTERWEMSDMNPSDKSSLIVPQRESRQGSQPRPNDITETSLSSVKSESESAWQLPNDSFELTALNTNETDDIVELQREPHESSQAVSGSLNSACCFLDEVIVSGERKLASAETKSLITNNRRTIIQNAILKRAKEIKAAREIAENDAGVQPMAGKNDSKLRRKKQKSRKNSSSNNASNNNSVFTVTAISSVDGNFIMMKKPAGTVEIHATENA
ncbi:uncharacterized protein [Amphiura filiformis]|uniref:uncharacterized protein n=1 Tax=Amphiura filiformis TaxID=82378 RepID=UPI003B226F79